MAPEPGSTVEREIVVETDELLVEGAVNPDVVQTVLESWSDDETAGAHTVFLGRVRADRHDQGTVTAIEFSAHRAMAEKALKTLVTRVSTRHARDRVRVFVQHGLGVIPVGGIPVAVCVATGHREQAFDICRGILEALKSEVPIYGKELFDTDSHRWKVNT